MDESASRPYPGRRPFQQADQTWFFGRTNDIAMLARLWQINRLTLLIGETGRGKSSLLEAGVLPSLSLDNVTALPIGRLSYGATFPFAALPTHNPYTLALLRSWSPGETATRLADLTIQEFIQRQVGKGPILAAIDPADELLADTGPRTVDRQRFLGQLAEALKTMPRFHLLVVGREEAASVVAESLGRGARFDITKLSWRGAGEALTQPLARIGRSFADGAAEKLLADLQTSHISGDDGTERDSIEDRVEPALLQIACDHLWTYLPTDGDVITSRDIRRFGDIDAALAAYWGTIIAEVAEDHEITAERLHAWLVSTFVTGRGARKRVHEGATTTAGMSNSVLRAIQDRYMLASGPQPGGRWYELLSDRLIEPLRRGTVDTRPPAITPDAHLRAAEHELALGEHDRAERHARGILRLPLSGNIRVHAEAHTLLGNIAFEREKPEEAEACYREAAELFGAVSDNQSMAHQLAAVGQTLVARGRFAEAVEELHAAAGRIPNDPVVQVDLALALWQLGEGRTAISVLTGALGIDGSNVAALQARGEILADLGEAREAMRDLDRVVLDDRPSIRAARGLALARLGDKSGARKEIDDAVADAQRNGLVLLYAARASHENGDDSAACYYARQAADATDPPLSPAHREVARQLAGHRRG